MIATLVLLLAAPATAQEVPDFFVPEDECHARPCTCDDAPMVELFRDVQQQGRDAWASVKADILSGTGPTSNADAVRLFQSRFPGDARINDQFRSCEGYDPAVNSLSKIAGVSPFGAARLDPCFCAAFCDDIVQSTIAHERMHVPTIVAGVVSKGDALVACSLGILSGYACDVLGPTTLADSEVMSHDAGLLILNLAVDRLEESTDGTPDMQCTWEPLEGPGTDAPVDLPDTLLGRIGLLVDRFVHGLVP